MRRERVRDTIAAAFGRRVLGVVVLLVVFVVVGVLARVGLS